MSNIGVGGVQRRQLCESSANAESLEETFERLFGDLVYLPYNKRILLLKIERYLANEDYSMDFFFDVFLYENYDDLMKWCEKTNRTIQYLD